MKHGSLRVRVRAWRRLFPGHRAGASLKHASERPAETHKVLFPGHRAGASLKPHQASAAMTRSTGSSPATEPGPH